MSKQKRLADVWDARKTKETHELKPHPQTGRLIDNHPGKRTIPMRLLVLGASRTGTMSIFTALEQLNYTPYHMAKALNAPKSNLNVWKEGLLAKFHGVGKPWGREEFDKILGNYDAVADVPCITFAEELIEAYPDAKVLLNNRDVDKWLESMQSTAGVVLSWKSWTWLSPWDHALAEPYWEFAKVITPPTYNTFNDFSQTSPAREAFLQHYAHVRKVCPKERLLEYRVQDGWKPLCDFVGAEIPEGDFPRINDQKEFIFAHQIMWYLAFAKMIGKISLMAAPIVVLGFAVWRGWDWS